MATAYRKVAIKQSQSVVEEGGGGVSRSGRIAIVLGLLACAVVLVVFASMAYVATNPVTVSYLHAQPAGQPVHLYFQTDGAVGCTTHTGDCVHPTWVSYRTLTPKTHEWLHTNVVELPAHARVDVTIYQYDSGSPLRNQFFGKVSGTLGDSAKVTGRTFKVINSYAHAVGHTFTVPTLGISVPLLANDTSKPTFCGSGPCPLSGGHTTLHTTTTFSFMTPKDTGNYRFQCFIPCGAGHYAGNAGPMQTLGYMGGFLEVQA